MMETEADGHEWAVRHLDAALDAELMDEKDFHVSLAVQLLTAEAEEIPHRRPDAEPELNAQNG